jgi:hypothetical protein
MTLFKKHFSNSFINDAAQYIEDINNVAIFDDHDINITNAQDVIDYVNSKYSNTTITLQKYGH